MQVPEYAYVPAGQMVVGLEEGCPLGLVVDGWHEGWLDGLPAGSLDGWAEGHLNGCRDGCALGRLDGCRDGCALGLPDGCRDGRRRG